MAEALSQTCNVCGARKQATNHWFRAAIVGVITPIEPDGEIPASILLPRLVVGDWADLKFPKPHAHICGAACLAKVASKFAGGELKPGEIPH